MTRRIDSRIGTILALTILASTAVAASPPPAGRTYFAALLGVVGQYELSAGCFVFTEDSVCSLDGELCGTWRRAERQDQQMELAFDLSPLDEEIQVDGRARLDHRGPRSSIGGTARIQMEGGRFNFAFAARAVPRQRCRELVDAFARDPYPSEEIVGSGWVVSESRSVRSFSKIAVRNSGQLRIHRGGEESLTITAEDNILPLLESVVRRGTLELGLRRGVNVRTTEGIVYRLEARNLDAIAATGSIEIDVGGIDNPSWTADLDGSSSLTALGRVEVQEILLSGSTGYFAGGLESRVASVDLSGSSHAVLRVRDRIDGVVGGSALLEYYGNPIVNVAITGSATVRRIGG